MSVLYDIKELNIVIFKSIAKKRDCNLGASQMRIIEYIYNSNNDVYQKDLEKKLNVSRATLSGILNTMEKNGLLKRLPSNIDSRSNRIVLNEKTKEIFSARKKEISNIEKVICKNISEQELDNFLEILSKMKKNLEEVNDVKIN